MPEDFRLKDFIPELDTPFVFNKRPIAISPDLRPEWKIAVTLLLLKICCRQTRSSYGRLHLLSWAVRTDRTRVDFQRTLDGSRTLDTLSVRIEPSLNRAVNLALGEKLLNSVKGDKIELAPLGNQMAEELLKRDDLFEVEKQFFLSVRSKVSEELVGKLFRMNMDSQS